MTTNTLEISDVAKVCVERDGIHGNVPAEEPSTELSLRQIMMGLPQKRDATFAEIAIACGLSENEAERAQRIKTKLEKEQHYGNVTLDVVFFLVHCIEKLCEKHKPKYSYDDIVEMHRHL